MKRASSLSGEQLVNLGATKHDASLPELGVKNVIPSGSWLENKQIQAAIESRKHLLEIEKIEKSGVLSRAEWDEELCLAEVTQIVGGHWQYLGHSDKKKTYLRPEEALYLLETNALQLTFNHVTVSVQQAYALLLRGKVTIMHYKVYASLSRVGYKVFRHEYKENKSDHKITEQKHSGASKDVEKESRFKFNKEDVVKSIETDKGSEDTSENKQIESADTKAESDMKVICNRDITVMDIDIVDSTNGNVEENHATQEATTSAKATRQKTNKLDKKVISRKEIKLRKLKERKISAPSAQTIAQCFDKLPEMVNEKNVKITAPDESLLPRNVFPNCTSYLVDLDRIKVRTASPADRRPYSASDEVNGSHIRRIRGPVNHTSNPFSNVDSNFRNQNINQPYFSLFNFQRWRNLQFSYNFTFQREFMNFVPRFFPQFQRFSSPMFQRFPQNYSYRQRTNINTNNRTYSSRRSQVRTRGAHLNLIKYLVNRLKALLRRGQNDPDSLNELLSQIQTFNSRHGTRLRLTKTFDVLEESETVTEVIILEDEDSPPAKKSRFVDDSKYKENLESIKDLSKRLVEMVKKGEAFARHRRALSNAIKIFNKAYNSELFIKDDNEIGNRKEIVIDSSDSDCVIEEMPVKSKKLRNPFNILKRRSLDVSLGFKNEASTSVEPNLKIPEKYEQSTINIFKKWLPSATDFGRPEIVSQTDCFIHIQNAQTELFLFDYLKEYNFNYENWCEVKTSFWESLKDRTSSDTENDIDNVNNMSNESLLSTEDFTDLPSMLEKIRVIRNCKDTVCDSMLCIDFDVYNRDVQNFRKTCPPKPHYRVICIDEQSPIPSGAEVDTLHAKYTDDVPILFAVVGTTGSINYLQMNPSDIPIYIPNSE